MGPEALPLGPYGGAAAAALLLWAVCVLCRRKRYRRGGSGAGAPRVAGLRGGRRGWAAHRALGRAPSARPSAARSPISSRRGIGAAGGEGAAGPRVVRCGAELPRGAEVEGGGDARASVRTRTKLIARPWGWRVNVRGLVRSCSLCGLCSRRDCAALGGISLGVQGALR